MFDKITVEQQPNYPQHIHRAPTDESVALLREMEQTVRDNVLWSGKVTNNHIESKWEVYRNPVTLTIDAYGLAVINGEKHKMKFAIGSDDVWVACKGKNEFHRLMWENVQTEVNKSIFKDITGLTVDTIYGG